MLRTKLPSSPLGFVVMNRVTPLILAVALFMEMMDATVISTSLPAIAAAIGTQPIALKLAMTAYMVALAIFIPISGWMSDRFGAKNVFRWAIFVFMLGSVACAFSGSLAQFVASRFLQGMGGAMMTPIARLVLVRSTPKKDLVNAMAWLTVPALVGPMAGPPIGGFLTTFLSWHWIFWINIPIGALGIVTATWFLPEIAPVKSRPLDWIGFLLAALTLSGVLFGLSVVSLPALPPTYGILSVIAGSIAGALYMRHAKRTPHPLLDPKIFRHDTFRTAIIGGTIFRIGIGALPFLIPLMLQLAFGMTPFESGVITFYGAAGALSAKLFISKIYARFGFKTMSLMAIVISTAHIWAMGAFSATSPMWLLSALLFTAGLVRSTFFTGINAMSYSDISPEESGQSTAIFAVSAQISFALGVALAGGTLEFLLAQHGNEIQIGDFRIAFAVVGVVALLALIPFSKLSRDAGSIMSGHGNRNSGQ